MEHYFYNMVPTVSHVKYFYHTTSTTSTNVIYQCTVLYFFSRFAYEKAISDFQSAGNFYNVVFRHSSFLTLLAASTLGSCTQYVLVMPLKPPNSSAHHMNSTMCAKQVSETNEIIIIKQGSTLMTVRDR